MKNYIPTLVKKCTCGGNTAVIVEGPNGTMAIGCVKCKRAGAYKDTYEKAIQDWNERN
jgi:hypothetical protein